MQRPSGALLGPLLQLLLLTTLGTTAVFSSRQGECMFPPRWEGTWFQSGVRQPIMISRGELSSKGKCLHNEGDKFLLVDQKSCYRCVVIHEKHSNVLQYKETYCHSRNSLSSLCSYITGDALLYSMFREEAPPVPCPFRGPMTFSYNRGHGTCSVPVSNVDTCTDDSRLLFRYQACPDIPASESAVEELECLATWKEGSSRYLVGRLHHGHASSNEDRYRCFVYEKAGQTVQAGLHRAGLGLGVALGDHEFPVPGQGAPVPQDPTATEIYRVAQSGDATCNGLFSPMEGSRTMTLKKVSPPGQCRFPNWLTGHSSGGLTWHTLDLARSYTFHPRNASLHVTRSNATGARLEQGPGDGQYVPGQEDQDVKILCNSIKQSNAAQTTMTMLVAHFTVGCRSGFMCMTFYRRDGHVIEVQTGSAVSRPEEACSPPHFQPHTIPFLTLVTSSPEPRTCPYLGKFTVTGMNRNQRNIRESRRGLQLQHQEAATRREREKVRHAEERRGSRTRSEFELEKRRANNEYLVHERMGRRARSNRFSKNHKDRNWAGDYSLEESRKPPSDLEEQLRSPGAHQKPRRDDGPGWQRTGTLRKKRSLTWRRLPRSPRGRRSPKMEDFRVDNEDIAQGFRLQAARDLDDSDHRILEVQDDYFGEYPEDEDLPKKRSSYKIETYRDLIRMRRDLEDSEATEEALEKREKREEDESRCSSEVTTLTIGCSTADRMEFQSDCVDEAAITAYSCHGRWFDAEGTQFVIATPLARRGWPNENNRPQPYRNSRRLCFMYKESGGVVSLTASAVACQRGIPPPPPMLAFNATSTGQCVEENRGGSHQSGYLAVLAVAAAVVVLR